MGKGKVYLIFTSVTSVLVGTILPLILGVKDPALIAIAFSSVWFIYAAGMLVNVFLINPGLRIKASRQNGVTVVRYELRDKTEEEIRQ